MTPAFDRRYWDEHWDQHPPAHHRAERTGAAPTTPRAGRRAVDPGNPYLVTETAHLRPGTALDAGCGTGAGAVWLAARGWQVTGADISARALSAAAARAASAVARVSWVRTDLTTWQPGAQFDLVVSCYAHTELPQLELYRRLSGWVAPGGTLLVVGHLDGSGPGGRAGPPENHPEEARVSVGAMTTSLDPVQWVVETAEEHTRQVPGRPGHLRDAVVRATRKEQR